MLEKVKDYLRNHTAELAIYAVMTGVSLMVAVAITGDVGEALARRGR